MLDRIRQVAPMFIPSGTPQSASATCIGAAPCWVGLSISTVGHIWLLQGSRSWQTDRQTTLVGL